MRRGIGRNCDALEFDYFEPCGFDPYRVQVRNEMRYGIISIFIGCGLLGGAFRLVDYGHLCFSDSRA